MVNWNFYAFAEANYVYNYDEEEAGVGERSPKALHIWKRIGKYTEPAPRDKMLCGTTAPETGWAGVGTFEDIHIQSIDDVLDFAAKWEKRGDSGKWHFCKKCYAILYNLDKREREEEEKPKKVFKLPSGNRLKILQKLLAAGADQKFINWVDALNMRDFAREAGIQYIEGQGNVYVQDPKLEKAVNDVSAMDEKFIEVQRGTGGEWVKLLPEVVEALTADE